MMNSNEIKSLRRGIVDGVLVFPKALRNIVSLIRKPNKLSEDKYINSILEGDDKTRIELDFINVGNDMRKIMKEYNSEYGKREK
ncbi:hypothetical protein [uncultured Weissella sp.]|uniref:hypothetical protein n=1 Tax=uncultured Weissella sp. TaxID=253243 RepID=UPI00258AA441|nr:hypothetical protein [uncultured Weissella sp.]